jgi:geranylgeranyl diphosphate synthase type I
LTALLIQQFLGEIDAYMRHIVDETVPLPADFSVMLRYPMGWVDENNQPYTQHTGKRIRPVLLLLCAETSGQNWKAAVPAAAAVELLHNFSLIHDDIQDNSPLRHNRPTVWKVWGEPHAINAGDAMFTLAFCAIESLVTRGCPTEQVLQVWHIFNRTALELTRGQHLDMRFERQPVVTVDEYVSMISGKSAALIAACAQMGALIGSGSEVMAEQYREFGLNLGLAFQIRDDILGIWGDPLVTGKSISTDILSRKKSLPVLFGLESSEALVRVYGREFFGEADVREAVAILDEIGAQQFAHETETLYFQRAVAALETAHPSGSGVDTLMELVNGLFIRKA